MRMDQVMGPMKDRGTSEEATSKSRSSEGESNSRYQKRGGWGSKG